MLTRTTTVTTTTITTTATTVTATTVTTTTVTTTTTTTTTAPPVADMLFGTPGTFSWTAPAGVTSVSVVAIGGGGGGGGGYHGAGGGGGGGLAYTNNIPVTSGQAYTVVVGAGGKYGPVKSTACPYQVCAPPVR